MGTCAFVKNTTEVTFVHFLAPHMTLVCLITSDVDNDHLVKVCLPVFSAVK